MGGRRDSLVGSDVSDDQSKGTAVSIDELIGPADLHSFLSIAGRERAATDAAAAATAGGGLDSDEEGEDQDQLVKDVQNVRRKQSRAQQPPSARAHSSLPLQLEQLEEDRFAAFRYLTDAMRKRKIKWVMLSYAWGTEAAYQQHALRVYTALVRRRVPVWMDVMGGMAGDVFAAMSEAVDGAVAIVPMMTDEYSRSTNCKRELSYSAVKDLPVVPVMGEAGLKPLGWLGLITAGALWTPIAQDMPEDEFEIQVTALMQEILHHKVELLPEGLLPAELRAVPAVAPVTSAASAPPDASAQTAALASAASASSAGSAASAGASPVLKDTADIASGILHVSHGAAVHGPLRVSRDGGKREVATHPITLKWTYSSAGGKQKKRKVKVQSSDGYETVQAAVEKKQGCIDALVEYEDEDKDEYEMNDDESWQEMVALALGDEDEDGGLDVTVSDASADPAPAQAPALAVETPQHEQEAAHADQGASVVGGVSTVRQWTAAEVAQEVCGLGKAFEQYRDVIIDSDLDSETLLDAADDDLKECGISNAIHIKKIRKKFADASSAAAPGAAALKAAATTTSPQDAAIFASLHVASGCELSVAGVQELVEPRLQLVRERFPSATHDELCRALLTYSPESALFAKGHKSSQTLDEWEDKFQGELKLGSYTEFHNGAEAIIGKSIPDEQAMRAIHDGIVRDGKPDEDRYNLWYVQHCEAVEQPNFDEKGVQRGPTIDAGHSGMRLAKFVDACNRKLQQAGSTKLLTTAQVLSMRLYTCSSFRRMNRALRGFMARVDGQIPLRACVHSAREGVLRFQVIPRPQVSTFRGVKGYLAEKFGTERMGMDYAFLSTSVDEEVGSEFSGSAAKTVLFEVEYAATCPGADISMLSLFPGEKEVLFAPCTGLGLKDSGKGVTGADAGQARVVVSPSPAR
jgi:hypothetical protein